MTDSQFMLVPFQGSDLTAIEIGGELHVALRPICEAIGVDWSAQYRRVQRDDILRTCVAVTTMQVPGELQSRPVMTIPISHLNGFLFGITLSRTKEEVRPALLAYQQECYRVLHDYWVKGAALNPRAGAQIEHSDRTARRRELPNLLDRMERERHPEKRRIIHELIVRACGSEGIEPPALDAIAPPTANEDAQADELLQRIDALIAKRPELDHHRRKDMIAVNRPQLAGAGVPISSRMLAPLRRHPRFIMTGTVTGPDKSWSCWVFRREVIPSLRH